MTLIITVKTELSTDQQLVVRIKDNGGGIADEIKPDIFEYLFTTKEIGKGNGMGLAIARQIIEETHSGQLSFISEVGKGTEFVIALPLKTSSNIFAYYCLLIINMASATLNHH